METHHITAVGEFPNPWANPEKEINAIRSPKTWYPSTDDFIAFAVKSRSARGRTVPVVNSTEAFIHLILDQNPKSIVRINLITHGTPGSVWFAGDAAALLEEQTAAWSQSQNDEEATSWSKMNTEMM